MILIIEIININQTFQTFQFIMESFVGTYAKKQKTECLICFEEASLVVVSPTCGHSFCKECIVNWVQEKIAICDKVIKCPNPGCKYELTNNDIKSFASPLFYKKYEEYMKEEYETNLQEILSQNSEIANWMKENARSCPKCKVLITKHETGCNSMQCNCGQNFCFCCGKEQCEKLMSMMISRNEAHSKMVSFQQNSLYQIVSQIGFLAPSESIEVIIKYNNFINIQNTHFSNLFHNKEHATQEEFDLYVMQGQNYNFYINLVQQGKIKHNFSNGLMDSSSPLLQPSFINIQPQNEQQTKMNTSFESNVPPLYSLVKHIGALNIKKKNNLLAFNQE